MDGVIVDFERYMRECNMSADMTKHMPGAYRSMQPIPGAIDAVRRVIDMGYEVWIATKPPSNNTAAYSEKAEWVTEHIPELANRVIVTHDKGLLGGPADYLIDDRPHKANCEDFQGQLLVYSVDYQWPAVLAKLEMDAAFIRSLEALVFPENVINPCKTTENEV